ncbi:hypothetical protein INR49_019746 [Caranx melampygus]|nr:hypothetical protein INR49_019746 [Caranx melampygus]
MTVRFKSQSEYQKSFGAPRSRSVSPQRWLRSDQMGSSREPGSQRQKRLGHTGLAQSCTSLLSPSDPAAPEPTAQVHRGAPSAAASRSHSAHRRKPSLEQRPPTPPPESRAESEFPAQTKTPSGPRPAAEPGRPGKPKKLHPSQPDSQPQPSRPPTAASDGQRQLSANEVSRTHAVSSCVVEKQGQVRISRISSLPLQVDQALRRRAGLRAGGQRTGGQRSEYNRQFGWRKHLPAASPLLTAERVLHSSNRSVPPFKNNWVSMETEYQRSFQGAAPPTEPRLRKHLEHQQVPLFHTHMRNKKKREESHKKPRQDHDVKQLKQLRQEASVYRRRAWGINFSRDHLNQLQSEHNALWEPSDATDSDNTPTPHLTFDLCQDEDSSSSPSVEALDLAREEGRLPTPRLKIRPVRRTHHDLTTPATGGAILVGKLKSGDEASPLKQQSGSAVSMAAGRDATGEVPVKRREAWSENLHPPTSGPSPNHKPASKPIRMKQAPPSPGAPPPLVPPPLHGIHGTLRHPDFQHNGELGLRFRELQCSGPGCGSDDDDRLSVMSWRSAASCSAASAVLERAQKRREHFWGKR